MVRALKNQREWYWLNLDPHCKSVNLIQISVHGRPICPEFHSLMIYHVQSHAYKKLKLQPTHAINITIQSLQQEHHLRFLNMHDVSRPLLHQSEQSMAMTKFHINCTNKILDIGSFIFESKKLPCFIISQNQSLSISLTNPKFSQNLLFTMTTAMGEHPHKKHERAEGGS